MRAGATLPAVMELASAQSRRMVCQEGFHGFPRHIHELQPRLQRLLKAHGATHGAAAATGVFRNSEIEILNKAQCASIDAGEAAGQCRTRHAASHQGHARALTLPRGVDGAELKGAPLRQGCHRLARPDVCCKLVDRFVLAPACGHIARVWRCRLRIFNICGSLQISTISCGTSCMHGRAVTQGR